MNQNKENISHALSFLLTHPTSLFLKASLFIFIGRAAQGQTLS